jgi:hypothetical protein
LASVVGASSPKLQVKGNASRWRVTFSKRRRHVRSAPATAGSGFQSMATRPWTYSRSPEAKSMNSKPARFRGFIRYDYRLE